VRLKTSVPKRLVAAVAVAATAITMVPATASAAASYVCVVKTVGVPVYNIPYDAGGHFLYWVNAGQKITVTIEWNDYRGLDVWGGQAGYIHKNYLSC
jgi:hypothetical protein